MTGVRIPTAHVPGANGGRRQGEHEAEHCGGTQRTSRTSTEDQYC